MRASAANSSERGCLDRYRSMMLDKVPPFADDISGRDSILAVGCWDATLCYDGPNCNVKAVI